ncbi:MAG: hypothetical protein GWP14_04240 [Actinobacteria bacterium]|nr:hypothetical protein [Actinomycetota bacterium]
MAVNEPTLQKSSNRTLPVDVGHREGLALLGLAGLMAFLVIVLVVTVVLASWVRQSGKERLTYRTLNALADAVRVYHQTTGEFPPTVPTNAQLLEYLNKVEPARKTVENMPPHVFRNTTAGKEILDGWGRPVSYVLDTATKRAKLISEGPDGDDPADNLYAEGLGSEF